MKLISLQPLSELNTAAFESAGYIARSHIFLVTDVANSQTSCNIPETVQDRNMLATEEED